MAKKRETDAHARRPQQGAVVVGRWPSYHLTRKMRPEMGKWGGMASRLCVLRARAKSLKNFEPRAAKARV